jgi:hypothetical protein
MQGIQTSCSDVSRRVLTNFLSGAGSGDEDLPRVSEDMFRVISGAGDSDIVGCSRVSRFATWNTPLENSPFEESWPYCEDPPEASQIPSRDPRLPSCYGSTSVPTSWSSFALAEAYRSHLCGLPRHQKREAPPESVLSHHSQEALIMYSIEDGPMD